MNPGRITPPAPGLLAATPRVAAPQPQMHAAETMLSETQRTKPNWALAGRIASATLAELAATYSPALIKAMKKAAATCDERAFENHADLFKRTVLLRATDGKRAPSDSEVIAVGNVLRTATIAAFTLAAAKFSSMSEGQASVTSPASIAPHLTLLRPVTPAADTYKAPITVESASSHMSTPSVADTLTPRARSKRPHRPPGVQSENTKRLRARRGIPEPSEGPPEMKLFLATFDEEVHEYARTGKRAKRIMGPLLWHGLGKDLQKDFAKDPHSPTVHAKIRDTMAMRQQAEPALRRWLDAVDSPEEKKKLHANAEKLKEQVEKGDVSASQYQDTRRPNITAPSLNAARRCVARHVRTPRANERNG